MADDGCLLLPPTTVAVDQSTNMIEVSLFRANKHFQREIRHVFPVQAVSNVEELLVGECECN
jgi:hypothetical protein